MNKKEIYRHIIGLIIIYIFRIKALNEYDLNKQKYDSALNSLEAAIIETRLKLDNELQPFVTAEEQQSLTKKCDEVILLF